MLFQIDMRALFTPVALTLSFVPAVFADHHAQAARNVVVYRQAGRFGGWPANHGIWSWGDEIVVGFEAGHYKYSERGHAIDYTRPAEHLLARSLDGGETWSIEKPESLLPPPGTKMANVPTEPGGKPAIDCPLAIDFTHPDFAMTIRMASHQNGPSRFYYSYDRGKTWNGPYKFPDFGEAGVAARTDYLVNGKYDLTAFVTVSKPNAREGRPVCVRTRDGGRSWRMLAYIGPQPPGRDYAIMPASVRLAKNSILTVFRRRHWIEAWRSDDDGRWWTFKNIPVPDTGRGNPPSLTKLEDGRLALVYGYRAEPYGIRAKLSSDNGETWSDAIVLREDGGNWDLGYPRTVQRTDGKLVTVYYYNNAPNAERFIGGTIWDPGKGQGLARQVILSSEGAAP